VVHLPIVDVSTPDICFEHAWSVAGEGLRSILRQGFNVLVPAFGPRMVCTSCGMVGADVRPNWQERGGRESLTGKQWTG
jgi:hypothetical protein